MIVGTPSGEINKGKADAKIAKVRALFLGKFAELAKNEVLARIRAGKCATGAPLLTGPARGLEAKATGPGSWSPSRYSTAYEARKKALGRSPYTPGDRFVLSGHMLGAWSVLNITDTTATIGFTDKEAALKAHGNNVLRPTFGLTNEEAAKLVKRALASTRKDLTA